MRKTHTELLKKAAVGYLVKKGYGVNLELGVIPWGKRKVDVIGINMKGHVIIMEVKSCKEDYKTDKKMHTYFEHCNQFYLVVSEQTYSKIHSLVTDSRVGILVLNSKTGFLTAKKSAAKHVMDSKVHYNLVLRLAWRNAVFSKRNTYRTRVYLE